MLTLAAQLESASAHAARIAAVLRRQQADWEERKAKGLPPRRISLTASLRERLPSTQEEAVMLSEIRALLTDVDFLDSGLSAALSSLHNKGEIQRIGEKSSYRYYCLVEAEKGTS